MNTTIRKESAFIFLVQLLCCKIRLLRQFNCLTRSVGSGNFHTNIPISYYGPIHETNIIKLFRKNPKYLNNRWCPQFTCMGGVKRPNLSSTYYTGQHPAALQLSILQLYWSTFCFWLSARPTIDLLGGALSLLLANCYIGDDDIATSSNFTVSQAKIKPTTIWGKVSRWMVLAVNRAIHFWSILPQHCGRLETLELFSRFWP